MLGRRQLIQFLSSLGLSPIKPSGTKSPNQSLPIYLTDFYIAGFRYYDGFAVVDRLRVGDELVMVREIDNPHDDLAIAVYFSGADRLYKLGYVPRSINLIPANLLDQEIALGAKITEIDPSAEPWSMVAVDLMLRG